MDKILAIVGPTGIGKSACSIELAQALDGQIISGDSMQVYRQMNIGTAKITESEMQQLNARVEAGEEDAAVAEDFLTQKGLLD